VDFVGGKEPVHGVAEFPFRNPFLLCIRQVGDEGRPKLATGLTSHGIATLPDDLAQAGHKNLIYSGFASSLVEAGDSGFRKEQTLLVTNHDGLAARTILVLLELELPKIAVRLLARLCLDACEVLPETEGAVPRRRP
jgi:hypothetical protein